MIIYVFFRKSALAFAAKALLEKILIWMEISLPTKTELSA